MCCVCVLCCLQNNPVFLSVTIFHTLKNENYKLCFLANFTFIGKRAYIYLLTLNKKQKIKNRGRVAWLIFVDVVSVCVVFCVLCCLQNNPVFLSVTIFHILKNENYEPCFTANFFVDQITTEKNYDRKKKVLC